MIEKNFNDTFRYVLTAAHCTTGRYANQLELVVGEHDFNTRMNKANMYDSKSFLFSHTIFVLPYQLQKHHTRENTKSHQ